MHTLHTVLLASLVLSLAACGGAPPPAETTPEPTSEGAETAPTLALPNQGEPQPGLVTGGQPTEDDLRAAAAEGYQTVITLRAPTEPGFEEERAQVEEHGMRFVSIPVEGADGVTAENAQRLDAALAENEGPTILHCGSGNRVGALMAIRAFQAGSDIEASLEHGRSAGLSSLEDTVRERLVALCEADAERSCE